MTEIISLNNAEHYTWGDGCDGWHLLKTGELSVIQERMPPGAAEVNHYHEHARQFFFVLSGEATLVIDQQRFVLGVRQGITVAPKTPHQLFNHSNQELSFMVVSAPASHGDRVVIGHP